MVGPNLQFHPSSYLTLEQITAFTQKIEKHYFNDISIVFQKLTVRGIGITNEFH